MEELGTSCNLSALTGDAVGIARTAIEDAPASDATFIACRVCTVVVFSLLVGARRRSAVRCGAERSGATARPKDFEEQSELEALSVLMECEKPPPAIPCTPCDSWPFTTKCT